MLGGLDGTGLESFDSAVTDKINDGRFADTLLDIIARDLCNEKKVNKLFSEFTLNSQQIYNMVNSFVTVNSFRFDYAISQYASREF